VDHRGRSRTATPCPYGGTIWETDTRIDSTIIRAFKAAATKRINALRGSPGAPVWQRNYHEHVIRDDESLRAIRQYIAENPIRWAMDQENPWAHPGRGTARRAPKFP